MSKRFYTILVAILVAILVSILALMGLSALKPEEKKKKPKEAIRYVNAEPVQYTNIKTSIKNAGRVTTTERISLSSEVSGIVQKGVVALRKGTHFQKGQLLIKIVNPEIDLNLKATKSRFLNTLANILADIKIDYPDQHEHWSDFFQSVEVNKPLPELPAIKDNQFKVFLASRNILGDFFTIKSQEARYKKHYIYAPFSGSFAQVNMQESSVVNPGAVIGSLINTSNYEIEVPVERPDRKWLYPGQKVVVYPEIGNDTLKGKVVRIADFIDPQTQTIPVYVKIFDSKKNPVYEGSYYECEFHEIQVPNTMELPRSAVFNHNEVFLVKDTMLTKHEINIQKLNEKTLYFNGIPEGAWVVNEALINANENMEVEIIESKKK